MAQNHVGEKRDITTEDFFSWPEVLYQQLSSDGKYISYTIKNQPIAGQTIILYSTFDRWRNEFTNAINVEFAANNKYAIICYPDSKLDIVNLRSRNIIRLDSIESGTFFPGINSEWIAYRAGVVNDEYIFDNLITKQKRRIDRVIDITFCPDGRKSLLRQKQDSTNERLCLLDLKSGEETIIFTKKGCKDIVFSQNGSLLAFQALDSLHNSNVLYIYDVNRKNFKEIISNFSGKIPENEEVCSGSYYGFSQDQNRFLFSLKRRGKAVERKLPESLTIWRHSDASLKGMDEESVHQDLHDSNEALYAVDLNSHRCQALYSDNESLAYVSNFDPRTSNYLIVQSPSGNEDEISWNSKKKRKFFLVDQVDGARHYIVADSAFPISQFSISPAEDYLIYYNPSFKQYFSYNIKRQVLKSITESVPAIWNSPLYNDYSYPEVYPKGICGYVTDGWVIIMSQYDIWKVDLKGERASTNLTEGIGQQEKKDFTVAYKTNYAYKDNDKIVLYYLNTRNKNVGFYQLDLSKRINKLTMLSDDALFIKQKDIIKGYNDTYLIVREDVSQSPNLFFTRDFKKYEQVSYVEPEKNYKWITSELMSWRYGEDTLRGILYKPKDFDTSRRYPIIFTYYNKISDNLHQFKRCESSAGALISIPYFVSKGYLVLASDINYTVGLTGQSALESINSAASHMSMKPYVDSLKMGLAGHSFGGFETNYIITHSTRYKAALSAAGMTDIVSEYGSLWGRGGGKHSIYEIGPNRMPGTLWEDSDAYISNSPVLRANNIVTPLLMMHNRKDAAVPFLQGIEFFTALRRLGKMVWLLEYKNESHIITGHSNIIDYQKRLLDFFDYYLKEKSIAEWMIDK